MSNWQFRLQQLPSDVIDEIAVLVHIDISPSVERVRKLYLLQKYFTTHGDQLHILYSFFEKMKTGRTPPVTPTEVPEVAPAFPAAPATPVSLTPSTELKPVTVSVPLSVPGTSTTAVTNVQKTLNLFITAASRADVSFDGGDPEAVRGFFKSLDRLRKRFALSDATLLLAIPELLKGRALRFYEARLTQVTNFIDLRNSFYRNYLSTTFQDSLLELMTARRQGPEEAACDFIAALITMNIDLVQPMSETVLTEFIRKRLHPVYLHKINISLIKDFNSLELECRRVAENLELEKRYKPPTREMMFDNVYKISPPPSINAVNVTTKPSIQCFKCGRPNVTVRQCGCLKRNIQSQSSDSNMSDLRNRLDALTSLMTEFMTKHPPPRRGN